MILSFEGRPAAKSCAWSAKRAPAKSTCASVARPQFLLVITAWTRPRGKSSSLPRIPPRRFASFSARIRWGTSRSLRSAKPSATPKASSVRPVIRASIRPISCSSKFARATATLRTTHLSKSQWRWNVKADAKQKPSGRDAGEETVNTPSKKAEEPKLPMGKRVQREILAWFWVGLAFLLINGTIGQARVIPSGSMENTLLIGDHLIMSRIGYDAGVPFTNWHVPLWRNPHRQDVIIFKPPFAPDQPDYVKRVIGLPGDTIDIHDGAVWVNGQKLEERYTLGRSEPG